MPAMIPHWLPKTMPLLAQDGEGNPYVVWIAAVVMLVIFVVRYFVQQAAEQKRREQRGRPPQTSQPPPPPHAPARPAEPLNEKLRRIEEARRRAAQARHVAPVAPPAPPAARPTAKQREPVIVLQPPAPGRAKRQADRPRAPRKAVAQEAEPVPVEFVDEQELLRQARDRQGAQLQRMLQNLPMGLGGSGGGLGGGGEIGAGPGVSLRQLGLSRRNLARAVIYKEILDPPKALREDVPPR